MRFVFENNLHVLWIVARSQQCGSKKSKEKESEQASKQAIVYIRLVSNHTAKI